MSFTYCTVFYYKGYCKTMWSLPAWNSKSSNWLSLPIRLYAMHSKRGHRIVRSAHFIRTRSNYSSWLRADFCMLKKKFGDCISTYCVLRASQSPWRAPTSLLGFTALHCNAAPLNLLLTRQLMPSPHSSIRYNRGLWDQHSLFFLAVLMFLFRTDFGRIEDATGQWRCAALLLAPQF